MSLSTKPSFQIGQGAMRKMSLTKKHRQNKALTSLFQMMNLMERPVLNSPKLILLATTKLQMRSHNALENTFIMKTLSQVAMMAEVRAETTWFAGMLLMRAVHRQTGGIHPQMQPRPFVTENLLVCNTSHVTQFKILSLTAPP
jgi:hypothetical protein